MELHVSRFESLMKTEQGRREYKAWKKTTVGTSHNVCVFGVCQTPNQPVSLLLQCGGHACQIRRMNNSTLACSY